MKNQTTEKNITLRNAQTLGLATRSDAFKMNPADIKIDWSKNPREDYGNLEEHNELKESIRLNGVMMPLYVHSVGNDIYLSHGFRRMQAVTELLAEGIEMRVPVIQMESNEEAILLAHFTLNTGKPLTDLEIGETLNRLCKLLGEDNFTNISKRSGIEYQKVVRLVNLVRNASTQVKTAIANDEMSVTTAIELVAVTSGVAEQNEVLAELKETAEVTKSGKKKLTVKAVQNATKKTATTPKAKKVTANSDSYTYLWTILEQAESTELNTKMQKLLMKVEEGLSTEELVDFVNS